MSHPNKPPFVVPAKLDPRAWLAAIVDSSDDAIISKRLDGIITSWNNAAAQLFGYQPEEIIGTQVLRLIPPELHHQEPDFIRRISRGERIDHFETVRVRKNGERFEVSLTISPIRGDDGTVVGASKIARDISAQREAQRKKDHFIAVLAHELRNPLAPVRNALTLIAQPGITEEQRKKAHAIAERQVAHMARLLEDLLDVSRLATGRVELRMETVDLGSMMDQALDAIHAQMEAKAHELTVLKAPQPILLQADPVRLTQILVNLLSNAAKYTNRGGKVKLEAMVLDGQARITVADNGIGFTPAMKARLFMLFEQADDAVARGAGGLGIGLALVREFVERHGGTVEAFSSGPNQGSVFTVRLPL
ncbi:MAG: PAS domain S-box protein [Usitatibacter sp.]